MSRDLRHSTFTGAVSASSEEIRGREYIQTISTGIATGGALVDRAEKLIGLSAFSGGREKKNGYAIPVHKRRLGQLRPDHLNRNLSINMAVLTANMFWFSLTAVVVDILGLGYGLHLVYRCCISRRMLVGSGRNSRAVCLPIFPCPCL